MKDTMLRQTFLLIRANLSGGSFWENQEAVDSAVIAHPAWDLTETKTWDEWKSGRVVSATFNDALQTNNTSGYRGVSFDGRAEHAKKPWRAYAGGEGRSRKHLGNFATVEEAVFARSEWEAEV